MSLEYYFMYFDIWNLIYCEKITLNTQRISYAIQEKIILLSNLVNNTKTEYIEIKTCDRTILFYNKNYKKHAKNLIVKENEWDELCNCYNTLRKMKLITEPTYIYDSNNHLSCCSLNSHMVTARSHTSIHKTSLYLTNQEQFPANGFENCFNLEIAFINATVPYYIPSCAFRNCYNLRHVEIKNCIEVKREAFKGCWLESIEFPEELKEIGYKSFSECKLPDIIYFPSSINMELKAFYKSNEKKIIFGGKIVNIGDECFSENKFLKEIEFKNSVQMVQLGKYAFKACTNLKTINLPNNIEVIKTGCFSDCLELSSISLPLSLIKIGTSAFRNCISLEKVKIEGNNIRKIGINAFYCCKQLTEIEIPSSIKEIELNAFDGCSKLESIIIKKKVFISDNFSSYDSYDGCLYDRNFETLLIIPQGKKGTLYIHRNLKHINKKIFTNKYDITNLIITDETEINAKNEILTLIQNCLSIE